MNWLSGICPSQHQPHLLMVGHNYLVRKAESGPLFDMSNPERLCCCVLLGDLCYSRKHIKEDTYLPYKVKTQYVQLSNMVDTSIKHPILSQFTTTLNGCMEICLIWWITAFSY